MIIREWSTSGSKVPKYSRESGFTIFISQSDQRSTVYHIIIPAGSVPTTLFMIWLTFIRSIVNHCPTFRSRGLLTWCCKNLFNIEHNLRRESLTRYWGQSRWQVIFKAALAVKFSFFSSEKLTYIKNEFSGVFFVWNALSIVHHSPLILNLL